MTFPETSHRRQQQKPAFGFNTHGNIIPLPRCEGRSKKANVTLIAATDLAGGIGLKNTIPWNLKPDMAQFRKLTMGHYVIMGRKTYESLPFDKDVGYRRLKGRKIVVISRNPLSAAMANGLFDDVKYAGSLLEALSFLINVDQIFIAGGAEIYAQAMDYIDDAILTEIHIHTQADVFLPPLPTNDFFPPVRSGHELLGTKFTYNYLLRRREIFVEIPAGS